MTGTQTKPIPDGIHTVTPHLIGAGPANTLEFYKNAFNAVEVARLPGPEGKLLHAQIRIGDSTVMLADFIPFKAFISKSAIGEISNDHGHKTAD